MPTASAESLNLLFNEARTHRAWLDKPVDEALLVKAYDLAKMAPTSANCQPMRILFIKSVGAKEKLKPCLDKGNVDKTMTAPVTAIIAHDPKFYEFLPRLSPYAKGMKESFEKDPENAARTAFRNGSLQGAYFMIAARAVGLDCGPMSGFNNAMLDDTFFKENGWKSNFLCNLGYGDASKLHPRDPRPEFKEFCQIL